MQIIILLNDVNKTKKSIPYICKVKREYCRFPNFQDFCLIGIEALQLLYFDKAFFMKKMNTQTEQWEPIADSKGIYYISNQGNAKSYKFCNERFLKPSLATTGYFVIGICTNGKKKNFPIHRLVAQTFIPNPQNKPQVNHRDGNKLNNNIDNLEWVTAKENSKHALDMGLLENISKSVSKPVIDIITGQKYKSLTAACIDIGEPYGRHNVRHLNNSKLQRFFYV